MDCDNNRNHTGKKEEFQAGIEQVMDYALDLKNFHLFSHDRKIVPILIPTKYKEYTTNIQFYTEYTAITKHYRS